jgi:hypothetical protein
MCLFLNLCLYYTLLEKEFSNNNYFIFNINNIKMRPLMTG